MFPSQRRQIAPPIGSNLAPAAQGTPVVSVHPGPIETEMAEGA